MSGDTNVHCRAWYGTNKFTVLTVDVKNEQRLDNYSRHLKGLQN